MQVNRLGVGDAVGICTNEEGDLVVDSNSPEVRQATVRPTYGAAAVQHMPAPPPGKAESFSTGKHPFTSSLAVRLHLKCKVGETGTDRYWCSLACMKPSLRCLPISALNLMHQATSQNYINADLYSTSFPRQ